MTTRRAVLVAGLGAVCGVATGACSGGGSAARPATTGTLPTSTSTSGPSGSPSATATGSSGTAPTTPTTAHSTTPPPTTTTTSAALWTPGPGELEPDVKSVAVAAVAKQVASPTLQVYDAQYGGLLDTTASVLVVTSAGTFDVRLSAASPHWTVTAIHPSAPGPAAASLSPAATALLADTRVRLPAAAEADVRSGQVHDSVLQTLRTLAATHTLTVSVVRSGHPIDVFGTDRPSDHPKGRAVDVWQIDGHAVVDPATPTSLVDNLMRQAATLGAYNIGGPRQLSGPQFFSDRTHHDHVHLGFST